MIHLWFRNMTCFDRFISDVASRHESIYTCLLFLYVFLFLPKCCDPKMSQIARSPTERSVPSPPCLFSFSRGTEEDARDLAFRRCAPVFQGPDAARSIGSVRGGCMVWFFAMCLTSVWSKTPCVLADVRSSNPSNG